MRNISIGNGIETKQQHHLSLLDIMVILTPLLDILTPLFRISSVQLMT